MRVDEQESPSHGRARAHLEQDFGHKASQDSDQSNESWARVPRLLREGITPLPTPWEDIFGPLRSGTVDDLVVIGQIGQSIDGRIATTTGRSHYINGSASLAHLHRLRATVDAVVVGVGTVCADDSQLTVRRVDGPNPARVVLDPHGRLPSDARFLAGGVRKIVVTAQGCARKLPHVEVVTLQTRTDLFAPSTILASLAERGLKRLLIEGGAKTLSYFLQGGCLDRLHVMVAPLILGSGRPGFAFGAIDRVDEALRLPARLYQLDEDVLFDFDLSSVRVPVWYAQKSV
jgi:riboflavin-specific deaminase-like protein